MAPRTRRSHTKDLDDRTQDNESQSQVPLQSSTLANTKIRSKVPARRVDPNVESQNLQSGGSRRRRRQTPLTRSQSR